MSNPEFQMQGVSFVISSPSGDGHALPFKVRRPTGQCIELQRALKASFTLPDVVAELRLLAQDLEQSITEGPLDFPTAVAGPTLHSAPVDSKPRQPT